MNYIHVIVLIIATVVLSITFGHEFGKFTGWKVLAGGLVSIVILDVIVDFIIKE